MESAALEVRGVSKSYKAVRAAKDVTLSVPGGRTLALLGPSGCGKSTLLRLIAGLEAPDSGRILMDGTDVTELPPEKRGLSLVFQDYALFPHLTVLGNVAYGPRARKLSKRQAEARAHEALDLVNLADLANRRVSELSGGQQQRVALARALAPAPGLLLLDEPLSNLDERLRDELQGELRALFRRLGTCVVLVTHNQREALALSDDLALMRAGEIVQLGPTAQIFECPKTAWTAAFLGHRNLLPRPGGRLLVLEDAVRLGEGEPREVLSRQHLGDGLRVEVAYPLGFLTLDLSAREALLASDTLRLSVDESRCRVLPDDLKDE